MFDIDAIELENFKSFVGKHTIKFPKQPGLYSITGRNLKYPRLSTNGLGKTSLLDAISWCLYGSTPRGLRANEVVSWYQHSCRVRLTLRLMGELVTVQRTQSPNSLILQRGGTAEPVTQAQLQSHIRLGPDAFSYAVILPQFGQSFVDLTPTAKLTLFSQIIDLDLWLDHSKYASELAEHYQKRVTTIEAELIRLQANIDAMRQQVADLKEQNADYENERRDRLAALYPNLQVVTQKAANAKQQAVQATQLLSKKADQLTAARQHIEQLEQRMLKLSSKNHIAVREDATLIGQIDNIHSELDELKELTGGVCPTCKQSIGKGHTQAHRAASDKKLKTLTDQHHNVQEQLADLNAELKGLNNNKRAATLTFDDLQAAYNDAKLAMAGSENNIQRLDAERSVINKQIDKEKAAKNPYAKMLADVQGDLTEAREQLTAKKQSLSQAQEQHATTAFWVGGFKRIRLMIIEDALQSLEIELNNSLASLGLLDWQIALDVERENKSGGVTKGFSVFITSPEYDQPVRLEAYSGGETQRLRLACDLGLANLILERAGLNGQIEVHDEPSEHISEEGLADCIETLYHRAHRLGKKIFVVDHHTLNAGDFDGSLIITKDRAGSHLQWNTTT